MGKKNKNKKKKVNPKRERYSKFRKEKPSTIDTSTPDLSEEQQKFKQEGEDKLGKFMKFNRRKPERYINERKAKSKR